MNKRHIHSMNDVERSYQKQEILYVPICKKHQDV